MCIIYYIIHYILHNTLLSIYTLYIIHCAHNILHNIICISYIVIYYVYDIHSILMCYDIWCVYDVPGAGAACVREILCVV